MTSRAVVGSSPMTIAGSHASAIAIIARWRIPPDSSCGYARAALLAGCPTSSSSSPARLRDAFARLAQAHLDRLGDLVAARGGPG